MRFDGPDIDPKLDQRRLESQLDRIRNLMLDGVWRTVEEIAAITGDPPTSVSAQLRNLRKEDAGGYFVDRRSRGKGRGLSEYQVLPPEPKPVDMPKFQLPLLAAGGAR